jgi:hypothetical protein
MLRYASSWTTPANPTFSRRRPDSSRTLASRFCFVANTASLGGVRSVADAIVRLAASRGMEAIVR